MKNVNYVTIAVVAFFMATITVNANELKSDLKTYEITTVNDLHMGKNVEAIWTVSYSKNEVPVTVVKRKTLEGIEYVVQNEFFAVSYASTYKGFGAKEVRKSWTNVPKRINNAVINKEELARQEIITPKKVNDKRALDLIANYLPQLLNDNYTHVLN